MKLVLLCVWDFILGLLFIVLSPLVLVYQLGKLIREEE